MFKLQLMTENDRREAVIIQRRKHYEDERQKRIFNDKERKFGKDEKTLLIQIEEKKQRDLDKEAEDLKFYKENERIYIVVKEKEEQENKDRLHVKNEYKLFNYHQMHKKYSKDGDLEEVSGPGGGIKLGLDDCEQKLLEIRQRNQKKAWLDEQIKERQKAEEDRKQSEAEWDKKLAGIDKLALELDKQEREARLTNNAAHRNYNLELHNYRKNIKTARNHQECIDDDLIFSYALFPNKTGDHQNYSNYGPGQKQPVTEYKGLSTAQLRGLKDTIYHQCKDQEARKHAEILKDKAVEEEGYLQYRIIKKAMRDEERKREQYDADLREQNRLLMEQQKLNKIYVNQLMGENRVTDEFFNHNRSTR